MCSVLVSVILLICVLISVNSKHREEQDKMARDVEGDRHTQSEHLECKNPPLVGCGECPCLYTKHILGDTFAADVTTSTKCQPTHNKPPMKSFTGFYFTHITGCFFLIAKTCL